MTLGTNGATSSLRIGVLFSGIFAGLSAGAHHATTGLYGWRCRDDLGAPQSEAAVILERFTLSADGTSLAWQAGITDPVYLTEPMVMEGLWLWVPGHQIKPSECALAGDTE